MSFIHYIVGQVFVLVDTSTGSMATRREGYQVSSSGDCWNPPFNSHQPGGHSMGWNNKPQQKQQQQSLQRRQPVQIPNASYYATPPL